MRALMQSFEAASREEVVAALDKHGGHGGKAAGELSLTPEQAAESAARQARYAEQAAQRRTEQAKGDDWLRRAREGGDCFTAGGTFTPWGAQCLVDAMRSTGQTIEFASQWVGRTRYSWSAKEESIFEEFESVHGGPRIGEPGSGKPMSLEAFCDKVVSDHKDHHNTFVAKTQAWFIGLS